MSHHKLLLHDLLSLILCTTCVYTLYDQLFVLFFVIFCFFFLISWYFLFFFFFFQAEDGIRDGTVTGVQTCALPILIDPRLDRVDRVAELVDRELRAPAVVRHRDHPHFPELLLRRVAVQHHRREDVVAVREDVRLDDDGVAHDALGRKEARVDLRLHSFNDDAPPAVDFRG